MKSPTVICFFSLAVDRLLLFQHHQVLLPRQFTGISSMVSEGIHSIIDAIHPIIVDIGGHQDSKVQQMSVHLLWSDCYFWAILSFRTGHISVLGGMYFSLVNNQGVIHFGHHPVFCRKPNWNYKNTILSLALCSQFKSMITALKLLTGQRGKIGIFWTGLDRTIGPRSIQLLWATVDFPRSF